MTLPTESPTADPTPIHHYTIVRPTTIRLALADLEPLLPEGAWIGPMADQNREITLLAAEVLQTNYPRVRFSTLRDLLPDCLQALPDTPEWITLPADRVALAYRLETRRQALNDLAAPSPETSETPPSPVSAFPVPGWKRLPKPTLAPVPAPVSGIPGHEALSLANVSIQLQPQALLRKIFPVGENLTVQQLINLAGELPGVAACVLCRLGKSVRSGQASPELDASALSEAASSLVRKMGTVSHLQLKPVITFYTESSPISFLCRDTTSLLVMHSEPGLLPRTVEKLEVVLETIEGAAKEL